MKQAVYSLKTVMLVTAASVFPAQLHAQDTAPSDAEADSINEIIVTGRLIEESVQEAPIAVTVFDAATLDKRGIDDLNELARSTPGFSFENFNGPFNVPVIRGQSQNRISSPIQNVSTFYNGVYLQRNYMIDASLLNMGQIEVLRGPQSAALGRNAFAGAISYTAKTPGDEYHGRALASVGENGFERYELSLEGPIVPGILSVIGGVSTGNYDGAWRNNHALANIDDPLALTRGNLGGYDYTAWHAGVNFTPIDEVSIRANYIRNERDFENTAQYSLGTASFDNRQNNNNCSSNPAFFAANPAWAQNTNMLFCGVIPVQPVLQPGETRKPGLVVDPRAGVSSQAEVLSVQADIKPTDQITLSYIFGYTQGSFFGANSASRNSELGLTGFFAGVNLIDTSGNGNLESTSHEVRLTYASDNGLTVYGGFFTSDTDDVTDFALRSVRAQTTGPLTPATVLTGPGFAARNVINYDVSSGFGFIQYENGSFKVSAEGRYTEETLTNTNLAGAAPALLGTATFDYFTPRVTASYFFTDDNSIYVSWGQGVKAGGFNVGVVGPGQGTFGTERNNTYELGLRNAFLGGDLILNATLFHIEGSNLQVSQPNTVALGSVVGNLGGSRTTGVELEASYKLSDPISIYANASYADSKYKDGVIDTSVAISRSCVGTVCAANGAIGGNRLERTPRLMLNGGFNFDKPLNDDVSVYANGHISYQDEQFVNAVNTAIIQARTIVDASAGVRWKNVDFRLAADNLFDEQYVANAFQLGLGSTVFNFQRMLVPNLGDRRRVMGSVIVSF